MTIEVSCFPARPRADGTEAAPHVHVRPKRRIGQCPTAATPARAIHTASNRNSTSCTRSLPRASRGPGFSRNSELAGVRVTATTTRVTRPAFCLGVTVSPSLPGEGFAFAPGSVRRSVVQQDAQQRAVDLHMLVVVDEAQPSELVHETADAWPCRADDVGQGCLADRRGNRLRRAILADIRQQKKRARSAAASASRPCRSSSARSAGPRPRPRKALRPLQYARPERRSALSRTGLQARRVGDESTF